MEIEMKNLRVSDETHRELSELGKYGDSMEDIIKRLLDFYLSYSKDKDKKEKAK